MVACTHECDTARPVSSSLHPMRRTLNLGSAYYQGLVTLGCALLRRTRTVGGSSVGTREHLLLQLHLSEFLGSSSCFEGPGSVAACDWPMRVARRDSEGFPARSGLRGLAIALCSVTVPSGQAMLRSSGAAAGGYCCISTRCSQRALSQRAGPTMVSASIIPTALSRLPPAEELPDIRIVFSIC